MRIETVGHLRTLLQDAPDAMPLLVYAGYIGPVTGLDDCEVCQLSLVPNDSPRGDDYV